MKTFIIETRDGQFTVNADNSKDAIEKGRSHCRLQKLKYVACRLKKDNQHIA